MISGLADLCPEQAAIDSWQGIRTENMALIESQRQADMTLSSANSDDTKGIVSLKSPYSHADTVRRLAASFVDHGVNVFAKIDQQSEAATVGLSMPPTTLIIYGNPKAGTPLMLAQPLCALDLPLKVLVSETAPGHVMVSFNSAKYLVERNGLAPEFISNLLPGENLIAAALQE